MCDTDIFHKKRCIYYNIKRYIYIYIDCISHGLMCNFEKVPWPFSLRDGSTDRIQAKALILTQDVRNRCRFIYKVREK